MVARKASPKMRRLDDRRRFQSSLQIDRTTILIIVDPFTISERGWIREGSKRWVLEHYNFSFFCSFPLHDSFGEAAVEEEEMEMGTTCEFSNRFKATCNQFECALHDDDD